MLVSFVHFHIGFEQFSHLKLKNSVTSLSSGYLKVLSGHIIFDHMKLDNIDKFYVDRMLSSSLEQHISLPTRLAGNSKSLIDH